MIVKDYLSEKIAKGTIHMSLLDPDKQEPAKAGEIARKMKDAGSDAVMIGGSTGVTAENLAATAKAIREASGLPTILFPSGPAALSNEVDAMFFMSLMNSSDLSMVIGSQVYGAPIIKKLGIETIPMGYVVVEPGMKVGEVGKAMLVKRNEVEKAVAYGLACEMMGMSYFYLEAGSGAPEHVPVEMIKAVKSVLSIPLIIGGGIRTPEAAKAIREAGADAIVTGTFIEQCEDNSKLTAVVKAAKGL